MSACDIRRARLFRFGIRYFKIPVPGYTPISESATATGTSTTAVLYLVLHVRSTSKYQVKSKIGFRLLNFSTSSHQEACAHREEHAWRDAHAGHAGAAPEDQQEGGRISY